MERLEVIAETIRDAQLRLRSADADAWEAYLAIGTAVLDAREEWGQNDKRYGTWLKGQHFGFGQRQAANYRMLAENAERVHQLLGTAVPGTEGRAPSIKWMLRQLAPPTAPDDGTTTELTPERARRLARAFVRAVEGIAPLARGDLAVNLDRADRTALARAIDTSRAALGAEWPYLLGTGVTVTVMAPEFQGPPTMHEVRRAQWPVRQPEAVGQMDAFASEGLTVSAGARARAEAAIPGIGVAPVPIGAIAGPLAASTGDRDGAR